MLQVMPRGEMEQVKCPNLSYQHCLGFPFGNSGHPSGQTNRVRATDLQLFGSPWPCTKNDPSETMLPTIVVLGACAAKQGPREVLNQIGLPRFLNSDTGIA